MNRTFINKGDVAKAAEKWGRLRRLGHIKNGGEGLFRR